MVCPAPFQVAEPFGALAGGFWETTGSRCDVCKGPGIILVYALVSVYLRSHFPFLVEMAVRLSVDIQ